MSTRLQRALHSSIQYLMPGPLTYWHTLRHLRPVQFRARLWFRVFRPRIDSRPAPSIRRLSGAWIEPARRRPSMVGAERFRFLNDTRDLASHGWDDPALEKLWRYNLHYFDDLNAESADSRRDWHRALVLRWVRENRPAIGTGWEPYTTSLRIVNWIKWQLGGAALPDECVNSLAVQARWLSRRLEYHLLGNHLFANAKALVFAGLFFEGREADGWLQTGLRILKREVSEQILADGGQFERSPMYHALALEDVLDLTNLTRAFAAAVPERWRPTVEKWRDVLGPMRDWLAVMCHPDGEISYFNDAAVGISATPAALARYATHLGFPSRSAAVRELTHLADSGYIRVDRDAAVVFLDVGPLGPDYLPGHGHADTLSFEMSLFGQRLFVNSGTSCYGTSAERQRQRGTAAHNTLIVNGQNSSEVWGGFRVARRARPLGLEVLQNGEISVRCAHDGYRRLSGKPQHSRRWAFCDRSLVVEDEVGGRFRRAEARFHLHPSIQLVDEQVDNVPRSTLLLQLPNRRRIRFSVDGGVVRTERTTWHPEFGMSDANLCLVVDLSGSTLRTRINWNIAA